MLMGFVLITKRKRWSTASEMPLASGGLCALSVTLVITLGDFHVNPSISKWLEEYHRVPMNIILISTYNHNALTETQD